jgi:aarF domain-containing kinase
VQLLGKAYPYVARRLLTDPSPELRQALEELLLKDGKFRWNRLENLMREGRKSQGFDDAQLWMLLDWLVSEQVRGTLEFLGGSANPFSALHLRGCCRTG